jgi:hypothetical protein
MKTEHRRLSTDRKFCRRGSSYFWQSGFLLIFVVETAKMKLNG